jgi:protocatechuate 3,4-dioxygenase beta subunit
VERTAQREALSDGDGRFELRGLAGGMLDLELRLPWGARVRSEHGVMADGLVDEVLLRVDGPANLDGQVLDGRGRPVAGARVALALAEDARDFPWAQPDELLSAAREGLRWVSADEQGRYDLGQVPAGQGLSLAAFPPAGATTEDFGQIAAKFELREGERRSIELTLLPVKVLAGQVLDRDGAPLQGAVVELEVAASRGRSFLAEAVTDVAGDYRFERVPATRVRLSAKLEGYRGGLSWINLALPGEDEAPDLVMGAAFTIRGQVVDGEGWAVPNARAQVTQPPKPDGRPFKHGMRVDEFGRFEFEGLEEGQYELRAAAAEFRMAEGSAPVVVLPGEPYVVLALEARPQPLPGTVTGEVVRGITGQPVPGLEIRGARRSAVLLDGTFFKVIGLRPGSTKLKISAPNYETLAIPEFNLPEGGNIDIGRYETRPTSKVRVAVLDPQGQRIPQRELRVRLVRVVETPAPGIVVPPKIDLKGERKAGLFQADAVGRYIWKLEVRGKRWATYSEKLRIFERVQDVRVQLKPKPPKKKKKKAKGG